VGVVAIQAPPVGAAPGRGRARRASRLFGPPLLAADVRRHYAQARGQYRVFNATEYRFYRQLDAPPADDATAFATSASLPATPTDTYGDGTWYVAATFFDGLLESGRLPLGPRGEPYLRLDILGGQAIGAAPPPPHDWRLEAIAGGVIRVWAVYADEAADRATHWALAYTTDGSEPAADAPDISREMPAAGLAVLQEDLPAQAHGTVVRVRLQTRRFDDPSWRYSEGSIVRIATALVAGPTPPL